MCEHGFIGACAECDGCGMQPEPIEEHEGVLERRHEFAADPVLRCCDCGGKAEGNVSVGGEDLCDKCDRNYRVRDFILESVWYANRSLKWGVQA